MTLSTVDRQMILRALEGKSLDEQRSLANCCAQDAVCRSDPWQEDVMVNWIKWIGL